MHMHKNTKTYLRKLEIMSRAIHKHMEPLYVWGCEPFNDIDKWRMELSLNHLYCMPTTWVHRQTTFIKRQQLMDAIIALHGPKAKPSLHLAFDVWSKDQQVQSLPYEANIKGMMLNSDFWIIRGQHTIEAMTKVMTYHAFVNNKNIANILQILQNSCCVILEQRDGICICIHISYTCPNS